MHIRLCVRASHTLLICLSSAHEMCVRICYLHVSLGGRPGALLRRQIQHIPPEAEKDFIVHAASEQQLAASEQPFGGGGFPVMHI